MQRPFLSTVLCTLCVLVCLSNLASPNCACAIDRTVPNGSVEELFRFIQKLDKQLEKQSSASTNQANSNTKPSDTVLLKIEALDKLLQGRPTSSQFARASKMRLASLATLVRYGNPWDTKACDYSEQLAKHSNPSVSNFGRFSFMALRTSKFKTLTGKERDSLFSDYHRHLLAIKKPDTRTISLGELIAKSFARISKQPKRAAELYRRIATVCGKTGDAKLTDTAAKLDSLARKTELIGSKISIEGTRPDGSKLNFRDLKGKVVLVEFWASWCGPCRAQIPHLKKLHSQYRKNGFEIVGVNLDNNAKAFVDTVAASKITWDNIGFDDPRKSGWKHPMAVRFGVRSLPTALLIDRDGKVVSVEARGSELDRLLETMCNSDTERVPTDAVR